MPWESRTRLVIIPMAWLIGEETQSFSCCPQLNASVSRQMTVGNIGLEAVELIR